MIPSVVPETNKKFEKVSNELQNLCKKYVNASFLNMSPEFAPSSIVKPEFYVSVKYDSETLYEHNVHLSNVGAEHLALNILDFCTRNVLNKLK